MCAALIWLVGTKSVCSLFLGEIFLSVNMMHCSQCIMVPGLSGNLRPRACARGIRTWRPECRRLAPSAFRAIRRSAEMNCVPT